MLERSDGQRTLGEVAKGVEKAFPERFPSADEALRLVTEVSQKYCR